MLPKLSVLKCDVDGAVARLAIDRPDVRNAIDARVCEEMTALLAALATDANVAVVIITGEGKLFASGADINELRARRSAEAMRGMTAKLFQAVEDFPRPTIAAI